MTAVSTSHFLSNEYLKGLSEKRLQGLIDNGVVRKVSAGYELTETGMSCFAAYLNNPAFVRSPKAAPDSMTEALGGEFSEYTGKKPQQTVEGTKVEGGYALNDLYERLNISGDDNQELQTELFNELKDIEGFTVNEDGTYIYQDKEVKKKIQEAITNFQENHKDLYTTSKGNNNPTTGNTELDEMLLEAGVYKKDDNGNVTVSEDYASVVQQETKKSGEREAVISGAATTTSTKISNADKLEPKKDVKLRDNKDERKRLETQIKEQYTEWVKDPKNQTAVTLYLADNKYHKQVDQRINELLKGEIKADNTYANGKKYSISKESDVSGGQVFDYYLNHYVSDEDKLKINQGVAQLVENDEMTNEFKEILKPFYGNRSPEKLSTEDKIEAAKLFMLKSMKLNSSDLLRMMAIDDVMRGRSADKIESDNKWFVEHQSKDYVRNKQAAQDNDDVEVHLSSKSRKGEKDGFHTDIGNKGRALVNLAPQAFCKEVSKADFEKARNSKDAEEFIETTITEPVKNPETGVYETKERKVYYKFDSEEYKKFMKYACNPSDPIDPSYKQKLEDLNITLKEGRDGLKLCIRGKNGELTPILDMIGKHKAQDETPNNSDLNAWRHMAEKAGLSTDGNATYAKRLGQFAKDLGITTALAVGVPALGNVLGGIANLAKDVAPQVIKNAPVSYHTSDRKFTTDPTTFTTPDKWVQGEPIEWIHNVIDSNGNDLSARFYSEGEKIFVPGETYTINGETYIVPGESGTIDVEDTKVAGQQGKINLIKTAAIGIGAFTAGWMLNKRSSIHAEGRNNDDIYVPYLYKSIENQEDLQDSFKVAKYSNSQRVNIGPTQFGGYDADLVTMRNRGMTREQYFDVKAANPAQPVISQMGQAQIGENNSYKKPAVLQMRDTTNGDRTYSYQIMDDNEVKQNNLDPANGPYYKVTGIVDKDGNNLFDGHTEIKKLVGYKVIPSVVDGALSVGIEYHLEQDTGMTGAGQSNGKPSAVQNWWDRSGRRTH